MSNPAKTRLLIHVRRVFKNGNKLFESYLKHKVTGVLKGMRSYTREKICLMLMKKWNGDTATVKKIHFDHSIKKEQLDIFLPAERAQTAYLQLDSFKKKVKEFPEKGDKSKLQELQSKLAHWQAVYEREGPIDDDHLQAVLQVPTHTKKGDDSKKAEYGQGGPETFTSTFYKAFNRKPTIEEDKYARKNGSSNLHLKVIKELEEARHAVEEAEHDKADSETGHRNPGESDGNSEHADVGDEEDADHNGKDVLECDGSEESSQSKGGSFQDIAEMDSEEEVQPPPCPIEHRHKQEAQCTMQIEDCQEGEIFGTIKEHHRTTDKEAKGSSTCQRQSSGWQHCQKESG